MNTFERLRRQLKIGQVYRSRDLGRSNVLKQLVQKGVLEKVAHGLYYYPAKASFGRVPPEDEKLVRAFLRSDDFLLTSPNFYNSLGVGTTQLYNTCVVYNHKRRGRVKLGRKEFEFHLKSKFPKKLSKEFLFVDLLNNLDKLAEDRQDILQSVKRAILREPAQQMRRVVNAYGGKRTKNLFNKWFE